MCMLVGPPNHGQLNFCCVGGPRGGLKVVRLCGLGLPDREGGVVCSTNELSCFIVPEIVAAACHLTQGFPLQKRWLKVEGLCVVVCGCCFCLK